MSRHSYHVSQRLRIGDPPFSAYIMAAMRKADSSNAAKLAAAFPDIHAELRARYDAPGGVIPSDPDYVEEMARLGLDTDHAEQARAGNLTEA